MGPENAKLPQLVDKALNGRMPRKVRDKPPEKNRDEARRNR